jgi:hypothetical protein
VQLEQLKKHHGNDYAITSTINGFAGTSVQYSLEINLFAGEPNQR